MKKTVASKPQADLDAAAWKMALANKGLVGEVINREFAWIFEDAKGQVMTKNDYEQEGFLGLFIAAQKFDPTRTIYNPKTKKHEPVKFSTYAWIWIKQAISRAFRAKHFKVARVAYGVYDELARVQREHGDEAGEWLAKNGKQNMKDGYNALNKGRSLQQETKIKYEEYWLSEDEPERLLQNGTLDHLKHAEYAHLVRLAAKVLIAREKKVLFMKFGISGEPLKISEIARRLKVGPTACKLAEKNGLRKIRRFFKLKGIKSDIIGGHHD